jgi:hypothetical protein
MKVANIFEFGTVGGSAHSDESLRFVARLENILNRHPRSRQQLS